MSGAPDRFLSKPGEVELRYDLMDRAVVETLAAQGDGGAQAWLDENPPATGG